MGRGRREDAEPEWRREAAAAAEEQPAPSRRRSAGEEEGEEAPDEPAEEEDEEEVKEVEYDSKIDEAVAILRNSEEMVRMIDLSDAQLDDDAAESLASALAGRGERLKRLCLSRNSIGDRGARALRKVLEDDCPALRHIDVDDNAMGPDAGDALVAVIQLNTTGEKRARAKNAPRMVGGARAGRKGVGDVSMSEQLLKVSAVGMTDAKQFHKPARKTGGVFASARGGRDARITVEQVPVDRSSRRDRDRRGEREGRRDKEREKDEGVWDKEALELKKQWIAAKLAKDFVSSDDVQRKLRVKGLTTDDQWWKAERARRGWDHSGQEAKGRDKNSGEASGKKGNWSEAAVPSVTMKLTAAGMAMHMASMASWMQQQKEGRKEGGSGRRRRGSGGGSEDRRPKAVTHAGHAASGARRRSRSRSRRRRRRDDEET